MMKTAAIYVRVRTIHNSQQDICKQMAVCQQYAKEMGLTVVKTYVELEELGKPTNRTQFPQILEDCKTAKWDAVITCSVDRITRNYKEYLVYLQELERNGKRLLIAQRGCLQ